jgi:hypothetical protein
MRFHLPLALVLAVTVSTPGYGWELCNLFGLRCGLLGCGGSCEPGCGCAPGGCGADCCGEVGCGCEPSCGCGSECSGGCQMFGGQTWNCCEPSQVPICECTGPTGCCESACGCGDVCGCGGACEPGCGCDPCGCDSGCSNRGCCLNGVLFGSYCGRFVSMFDKLCGGCNGCSGEVYWSEWHNDPPRCHEPCDCCGNYTGPSYAGIRAPYDQGYHVGSAGVGYARGNVAPGTQAIASGTYSGVQSVASRPRVSRAPTYRNESAARPSFPGRTNRMQHVANSLRPITRGQITRKPATGSGATYQR